MTSVGLQGLWFSLPQAGVYTDLKGKLSETVVVGVSLAIAGGRS
jgi:hypothetical protein